MLQCCVHSLVSYSHFLSLNALNERVETSFKLDRQARLPVRPHATGHAPTGGVSAHVADITPRQSSTPTSMGLKISSATFASAALALNGELQQFCP